MWWGVPSRHSFHFKESLGKNVGNHCFKVTSQISESLKWNYLGFLNVKSTKPWTPRNTIDDRGKTSAKCTVSKMYSIYSCEWVPQLSEQQPQQTFTRGPQASPKTQNTHSEAQPPTRQSMCGVDCLCHVHAETQQGKALVFSIHCPPNPLINTDTHISLTSPPPLSSDAVAKPPIGLKSAKHNPAILLISETTCAGETTGKNKGAGRGFMSWSGSARLPPLVSKRNSV